MCIHSLNMIGILRPVCVKHGRHQWRLARITLSPWCVLYLTHFLPRSTNCSSKSCTCERSPVRRAYAFPVLQVANPQTFKMTSNTTQSSSAGSVHIKSSKSFLSSQPLATAQRWGDIQYSYKITFAIALKMSPKFWINRAKLAEQRRKGKRLDLILVFELMTGAGEAACHRGDCHSKCTCGCYHAGADLWWQQRWLVIFNCFPPLSGGSYLSEACL